MYKLYAVSLLLLGLHFHLAAQSYTFSVATETYTPMEGGVSINNGEIWEFPDYKVPLGFTFRYFGESTDTLYFNSSGISAALTSDYADTFSSTPTTLTYLIPSAGGLIDNGSYLPGGGSLSALTYHRMGTSPNQIGVIQFDNASVEDESEEDNSVDLQVWLYESDGTVEMHYGPSSEMLRDEAENVSTGPLLIKDFLYDEDEENQNFTEAFVLTGDPADPTLLRYTDYSQFPTDYDAWRLETHPVSGTVYRFTATASTGLFDPGHWKTLALYPNPSTGPIEIRLPDSLGVDRGRFEVFDAFGRRLRDLGITSTKIDLSGLAAGVYLVKLTSEEGAAYVGRLIKR